MGIFDGMFKSKFETYSMLLDEVYSTLSVCEEGSHVIITIKDPMKADTMEIAIEGKSWMNNPNFAVELKEFNHILSLNVKYGRTITVTIQ